MLKGKESRWLLAALLLTLALAFAQRSAVLPANWWLAPWILSFVLFGLPHGALDHEVALQLWEPRPPPPWTLGLILAGYLALSLLILASWFVAPAAVFFGFILLTWAHWGLADLWWSWRRDAACLRTRLHRSVFALWRGSLPMLIPLAVDPALYRQTAEATCHLFLRAPADFHWLESDTARLAAVGVCLVLGALDFLMARRDGPGRWLNMAEGAGLLIFFGALPALASVGFYFAFWHGLRHVLRLMAWRNLTWAGFALHAIPATLGALVLLGLLACFSPPKLGSPEDALGLYLALIAALTVPHAVVVGFLDWRDGLWQPRSGAALRSKAP